MYVCVCMYVRMYVCMYVPLGLCEANLACANLFLRIQLLTTTTKQTTNTTAYYNLQLLCLLSV